MDIFGFFDQVERILGISSYVYLIHLRYMNSSGKYKKRPLENVRFVSTLFPSVQCPVSPPYPMSGPGPLMLPSSDAALPLVESSGTGDTGDTGLRALIGQEAGDNLSLVETSASDTRGEMGQREFAFRIIFDNVYTSLGPICCHHNSFVVNPRAPDTAEGTADQSWGSFCHPFLLSSTGPGHSRLTVCLSLC